MNQGKTLWMIDAVNAEMDTLYQSKKIMAYPTDLNMTDFFLQLWRSHQLSFGKDLKKSALLRLQTGQIAGKSTVFVFSFGLIFQLGLQRIIAPITKKYQSCKI